MQPNFAYSYTLDSYERDFNATYGAPAGGGTDI